MSGGGVPMPVPWSCIRNGRCWLQETSKHDEPKLRLDSDRIMLARTTGMVESEA
jgi:hypothetical protein